MEGSEDSNEQVSWKAQQKGEKGGRNKRKQKHSKDLENSKHSSRKGPIQRFQQGKWREGIMSQGVQENFLEVKDGYCQNEIAHHVLNQINGQKIGPRSGL